VLKGFRTTVSDQTFARESPMGVRKTFSLSFSQTNQLDQTERDVEEVFHKIQIHPTGTKREI